MQEREISRYQEVAYQGAAAIVFLEEKEDELVKLQGQKIAFTWELKIQMMNYFLQ